MHFYAKKVIKRPHAMISAHWAIPALCAAYDWPKNCTGTGPIGIIELGGGYQMSDVVQAFTAMGLPAPSIANISTDGMTNNAPGNAADGEVALDIQIAGAAFSLATGRPASIHIYWGNDIATCVAAASANGCTVCSISWGTNEANWGAPALEEMERVAAEAVSHGMLVFAASGDNDSGDGGDTPVNVDGPSSCPHVIACGGTALYGARNEVVWNNNPGQTNGEGTGGGFSAVFPPQPWQLRIPKAPTGRGRMVPDVAANADPLTGYEIVLGGQVQIYGGTSAVAPLYAGLFAAIGPTAAEVQLVQERLYRNPHAFTDIAVGDNGAYVALPNQPDPCTGMGSPRGGVLNWLFKP